MAAANAHTLWLAEQTDAEYIFQCSADDYSLPERVSVCMAAVTLRMAYASSMSCLLT